MNANNNGAKFTTLNLVTLGYCEGAVAVAYSESLSVSGTVATVQGDVTLVGLFRVMDRDGVEVASRTFRHWDRARVARDVAASMAEYGVTL